MNSNNNSSMAYNYANPYTGGQPRYPQSSANINSNNYQPHQQTKTINPTLLPYHEYMAMQKQSTSNPSLSSSSQTNTYQQPYLQNRQGYSPNQYQGPNQGYPLLPYNQYVSQNNSQYSPYQQQPYYYGQAVPNTYANHQQYQNEPKKQMTIASQQNLNNYEHPTFNSSKSFESQKKQQKKSANYGNNISSPTKVIQQVQKKTYNQGSPQSYNRQHSQNSTRRHNDFQRKNQIVQDDDYNNNNLSSNEGWSQQQEQQQLLYQKYESRKNNYYSQSAKNKPIAKKKDPVIDAPDQIRKWIEARKRNYPGLKKKVLQEKNLQANDDSMLNAGQKKQMSKLQAKIRKKLIIVNGDSRSIMKKIKNIQILRRIIQDPKILKRQRKYKNYQNRHINGPQVQEKIELQSPKIDVEVKIDLIQEEKSLIQEISQKVHEIKAQSSQSQESIEPMQVPANKVPKHQIIDQLIDKQKQQMAKNKSQLIKTPQIFEYIQKDPKKVSLPYKQKSSYQRQNKRQAKVLDPETIIAHLKQKQLQDKQSLNSLFDYKSNSYNYNYRVQTLQTSLKLDEIFAQTTYMLQAIRYIIKEKFFEQNQQSK